MKRKMRSCHSRRIPNRNNKKIEIKREIEGYNRGFKEETENISIRSSRLQFFFFFSSFLSNYKDIFDDYKDFIYCFIINHKLNLIVVE